MRRAYDSRLSNGVRHLSNYILFNYKDTPQDFYERYGSTPS